MLLSYFKIQNEILSYRLLGKFHLQCMQFKLILGGSFFFPVLLYFLYDQGVTMPCLFLSGKWLGSRQIRCNWATKGAGGNEEKQNSDTKSVVELTNGSSG